MEKITVIGGSNDGKRLSVMNGVTPVVLFKKDRFTPRDFKSTEGPNMEKEVYRRFVFRTSRKNFVLLVVDGMDDTMVMQSLIDRY